ncbi:MAG: hypothetical protein H6765_00405 [Candidatus Peribacteria bacterium]|nr:MAG: hypothetical protein H6765_00405 [Candidatus Peribacteria bacterium]
METITNLVLAAKQKVVTIAGPSASGKSYFAKQLATAIRERGHSVLEVSSDDYYTNDTQLHAIVYGTFDHPNLIEYDKLNRDLAVYLESGTMHIPQYSFVEKRTVGYKEVTQMYDYILVE